MEICDAHNDLLMNLTTKTEIKDYIDKYCINNKVVKMFTAYYVSPQKEKDYNSIVILKDLEEKFNLIKDYKMCIPTIENIGFIDNSQVLDKILTIKPFCVTLTWNYDNKFAGGAYGESGLTDKGKELIKILENRGIRIDVAHLNKKSFIEFSEITKFPIFCSHTSSRLVYDIPRALDREQMSIIKESKGFVGLCLYSSLLSDKRSDNNLIYKHLSSFLNVLAPNNLGFGTDFNATGENNPIGFDIDYNGMSNLLGFLISKIGFAKCKKIASENILNILNEYNNCE